MRGLLIFAVAALLPPDRPDPSPKLETAPGLQKVLLGEWRLVKNIVAGTEAVDDGLLMVFTTEALQQVQNRDGNRTALGSYKYVLDLTRKPARITFPETKYDGIVKIEGETLTICFSPAGSSEPPAQFGSSPATRTIILQATRLKK